MKKTIISLAIACVSCMAFFACSGVDREHTLKVYNWGDYIDESLIGEFEQWYEEQTGEPVKIIYQTFDINEVMLSKIELGHEDFDVVCPSDYIIERMLRSDLLLPIVDRENPLPEEVNYLGTVSPYIKGLFSEIVAPEGIDPNDYAIGYMWGTTGFLYNTELVDREEVRSWGAMFNEKFYNKILIKDAFRDVYSTVMLYIKAQEMRKAGLLCENEILSQEQIKESMYDASDESIALFEQYMEPIRDKVLGWEADFGKEMMCQKKALINVSWSGDAAWAMQETADTDVKLDYIVPDEGSNAWFDGWVIPKYAKNVKAARYFISFMCRPDNAVRNMDEIGYVSTVGGKEIFDAINGAEDATEICDVSYFFTNEQGEPLEGAEAAKVNPVKYPDLSVTRRCAMMHDSGERTEALLDMWSKVKSAN